MLHYKRKNKEGPFVLYLVWQPNKLHSQFYVRTHGSFVSHEYSLALIHCLYIFYINDGVISSQEANKRGNQCIARQNIRIRSPKLNFKWLTCTIRFSNWLNIYVLIISIQSLAVLSPINIWLGIAPIPLMH